MVEGRSAAVSNSARRGKDVEVAEERPDVRLRSVVIDCPDPPALAAFYAQLLDGRSDTGDPEWCEVRVGEPGLKLAFQKVDSYQPPEWPDGSPQQSHLDLTVSDLGAASRRAVSLGASVLSRRIEEPGCVFIVHADPSGHPFCLCEDR
jgi:predicted enzyme related to lactoylglutathione lyase